MSLEAVPRLSAGRDLGECSPTPPFASPARFRILLTGLAAALVTTAAVCVSIGPVSIPLTEIVAVLWSRVSGADPGVTPAVEQIVWTVRLPRVLLACLAGAALAVSGAVIQAVVRNPLGDPYLIGIVPGAGLGAVIVIVLGSSYVAGLSLSFAAFGGALAAFVLTFALGRQGGEWPPTRLVLAGVAVGYLLSAFTFFLQTLASPNELQRVLFWSLGSVSGAEWRDLPILAGVVGVGMVWLVLNARGLNALVNGADLTRSLGIDVGRFQFLLMLLTALVTGCAVAVVGGIGFVGLMVPHLARLLVGADHRRVLLCCVLLGALLLLLADLAARMVLAPSEIPVGIVTAAGGAPFFLWLLTSLGRRAGPVR